MDANDIVFVLSGGSSNNNPLKSLGGDPSTTLITNGLDNLFNDISAQQAKNGYVDYRCFYIFNNNSTDNFLSTSIWIDSVVSDSSKFFLGINLQNEVQQITINGNITGGFLQINYESNTVVWNWNSNSSIWALNLQNALNSIINPSLTGIIVTVTNQINNSTIFKIEFAGNDSNRFQPLLSYSSIGNLIGCTGVGIVKLFNGSPINSIAPSIDAATTQPFGITFMQPSINSPIILGTIRNLDGFPVWTKRIISAGASSIANAGLTVKFTGST